MKIYGFMTDGLYKFKKGVYFIGLNCTSSYTVNKQTQEKPLQRNKHSSLYNRIDLPNPGQMYHCCGKNARRDVKKL